MTVSLFPAHRRTRKARVQTRSKRDDMLAELLQSLRGMTISLGTAFQIEELSSLSGTIAQLQLGLLETSEYSLEGVVVRHRCQQLFESVTCRFLEIARNVKSEPDLMKL